MTERYLTEQLPQLVVTPADRAIEAYMEHSEHVDAVTGDISDPGGSAFSWAVANELIDAQTGGLSLRERIAETARQTSVPIVAYPIRAAMGASLRLHTDGGSLLVVSARDGRPMAADNIVNPEVPAHYGAMDPYVLRTIALAGFIDSVSGMVACRAAVFPARHLKDTTAVGWDADWRGYMKSGWPDPDASDNRDVNWN